LFIHYAVCSLVSVYVDYSEDKWKQADTIYVNMLTKNRVMSIRRKFLKKNYKSINEKTKKILFSKKFKVFKNMDDIGLKNTNIGNSTS
jgi:hypothetical protein